MPCAIDPAESAYYAAEERKRLERDGRWDLLASKEQLAGWLCDAIRGEPAMPDAVRWFIAHKKFNDGAAAQPGASHVRE